MNHISKFLFKHSKKNVGDNFKSTHTRIPDKELNIYAGNYCIQDKEEFWKTYYEEIIEKNYEEYLTEVQDINGTIAIDFDFRYSNNVTERQHGDEEREDFLMSVTKPLKEFYEFKNNDTFDVFVFEKPNVNVLKDETLTKDGIHIIIGLNMSSFNRSSYRTKIMELLEKNINLPLINSWDSVVDEALLVPKNENLTNWQLFGSKKPANQKYELIKYFEYSYDSLDREYSVIEKSTTMNYDLFKKISVQNLDRPNIKQIIHSNIETKTNKTQNNNRKVLLSPISITEVYENENISLNESDIYYKYLNCIGNKMCGRGDYHKTYIILQALKNENLNDEYVKYWIHKYAYHNSKKYIYAIKNYEDKIIFTPLNEPIRASVKTLKTYAKTCNPELYSKYFKDDYEFRIKNDHKINIETKDFSGFLNLFDKIQSEKGLKDLYFYYKKERVIYKKGNQDKNDIIYLFYNDEWNKMTNKGRMVKNDMEEFFVIVFKVVFDYINEFKKVYIKNEEEITEVKKKEKILFELNKKTLKSSMLQQIYEGLLNNLSAVKSNIEFDIGKNNYYNIHFKNGVYEIKNKKFRSRLESDYVTETLEYDYIPKENISKDIQNSVLDFFKKIQPNEEQRKFTLSYLAYCITGNTKEQVFKMNIGHTASNGKSTELSIHSKCFSIYTEKMDNRVLQMNFEKRHKFISNLVTKPIRLIYFEEMPKGKKLDVEFIKDIVDGDKIDCEVLFGTKDKINIQSKLMSVSNHDFECDTDEGIIRRGRVQKYLSRFVGEDDYYLLNDDLYIYKKDKDYNDKFDDDKYKNAYFHLLLEYIDEVYIPKENKDEFKKTAEEGDIILNNLLDEFVITKLQTDITTKEEICVVLGIGGGGFADYKGKLQNKGCLWDSQKKKNYNDKWVSGIFTGVRRKTQKEKEDIIEDIIEEIEI